MASIYTKIPRAVEELKLFLDYNYSSYSEAAKHIKPGQGWNIPYFSDEIFQIVVNLEGNLYEGIYPKLMEENPEPDEEILNSFSGALNVFEGDIWVFEEILKKRRQNKEDRFLSSVEGIVQNLLFKAIHKIKEVIQLANEDFTKSSNELTDSADVNGIKLKEYTIGIVTATFDEIAMVKSKLSSVTAIPTKAEDSQIYYSGYIEGNDKKIKVILTQCHHQGIAAASTTSTKLILNYAPEMVVMLGHAAGNKNLLGSLGLGDILICSEAIDYDQVVITEKVNLSTQVSQIREKDRKVSIASDQTLIRFLQVFASDPVNMNQVKERAPNKILFSNPLNYKVGKLISGDALVRSETWFEKVVSDNSGCIGLDMETYGVYYASQHSLFKNKPIFVSIKAVSDFGSHKSDFSQELKDPIQRVVYATHNSVEFFFNFAIAHLPL